MASSPDPVARSVCLQEDVPLATAIRATCAAYTGLGFLEVRGGK
jgi:hypothetical protein